MTKLATVIDLNEPQPQGTRVILNWREYFVQFVKEHGEPIDHEGRLLFRDGWQYSSSDYQGPEYAPPKNLEDLKELKVTYWETLYEILSGEIRALKEQIKGLAEWQNARSMPLQQVIVYESRDEDGKKVHLVRADKLDLAGMKHKLKDLEFFRDESQEMLDELTHEE